MYIDKDEFDKWMKRIMECLEAMDDKLKAVIRADQRIKNDIILDNQDLMTILKISPRTLQRIRSSGKLPYHVINKKTYFLKSNVEKYIAECFGKDTLSSEDKEPIDI